MIVIDDAELTAFYYNGRRDEMVEYLVTRRQFTRKAAIKAINNFIDSQVYVARTGQMA